MGFQVYSQDPETKLYNDLFVSMLKLNFRSHPDILKIPNKLFYDGLLKVNFVAGIYDILQLFWKYSHI